MSSHWGAIYQLRRKPFELSEGFLKDVRMKSLQSPAVGMTPLQCAGLRHSPMAALVTLHQVTAVGKRYRGFCRRRIEHGLVVPYGNWRSAVA